MTIQSLLLGPVNRVLNEVLRLDPDTPERMQGLQNCRIDIHLQGLAWSFCVVCLADTIQIQRLGDVQMLQTTSISAPPVTFLRSLVAGEHDEQIHITGDAQIGEQFLALLTQLEIDWEALLATVLPGGFARQLANLGRDVQFAKQRFVNTSQAHLDEWLHEVIACTPYRFEVSEYFAQIVQLQNKMQGLQRRMTQLNEVLKGLRG